MKMKLGLDVGASYCMNSTNISSLKYLYSQKSISVGSMFLAKRTFW